VNGVKGFGKGGNVPGFLSVFAIYPEKKFGVFIATNTQTDNFFESFVSTFFNTYYPIARPDSIASSPHDLSPFAGTYADNRTNYKTIEELAYLYRGKFELWVTKDHHLSCYHNGQVQKYRQIDSLVFQNIRRSQEYLVFKKNKNNEIEQVYRNVNIGGFYVPVSLTKVTWYDDPVFINDYYFFVLVIIWLFILILPFRAWVWYKRRKIHNYMNEKLLPAKGVIAGFLILFFYTLHFILGFLYFFRHTQDFFFGIPAQFKVIQFISYLFPLLVVIASLVCVHIWLKKQSNIFARLYFSLVTLASIIHLLFLFRWHFIGLNV
jgi:hypothetical protein